VAPNDYVLQGQGQVEGRPLTLATPAALRHDAAGWHLAPTSIGFGGGSATIVGLFGGGANTFDASLQAMPLAVLDMLKPGLASAVTRPGG